MWGAVLAVPQVAFWRECPQGGGKEDMVYISRRDAGLSVTDPVLLIEYAPDEQTETHRRNHHSSDFCLRLHGGAITTERAGSGERVTPRTRR